MPELSLADAYALSVLIIALGALMWLAHTLDCRAKRRQEADANAAVDTAETLIRAFRLKKVQPAHSADETNDAISREKARQDHIRRLATLRAHSRRSDIPAKTNLGPGLRPHPVHSAREQDENRPWVIPPASFFEPHTAASCETGRSNASSATEISTLSIPASLSGGGEFSGAGSSGSWDSTDTSSTTTTVSTGD